MHLLSLWTKSVMISEAVKRRNRQHSTLNDWSTLYSVFFQVMMFSVFSSWNHVCFPTDLSKEWEMEIQRRNNGELCLSSFPPSFSIASSHLLLPIVSHVIWKIIKAEGTLLPPNWMSRLVQTPDWVSWFYISITVS